MNNIVISPAKADEWESAMEVAWRTFLKFEAPVYTKEGTEHFLEFISGERLYKMFLCGEYKMLVAKDGERVAGVACLRAGNHISLLFVEHRYQRFGIGRRLVSELQRMYCSGDSCQLTVNAAPCAIGFYEKLGFIKTDDMKTADGITYLPMRCMVRISPEAE